MTASLRLRRWGRVGITAVALVVVQTVVFGLAALPPVLLGWLALHSLTPAFVRLAIAALLAMPLYVAFALLLLVISPLANRLTGAYTPPGLRTRIADLEWPLLRWARYVAAGHLVRVVAGTLFQGSPVWTFYLRLNGAHVGRRVFVNSTTVSDHNLLEFGDDVVIGAAVHLSGHTVERGYLFTDPVRLADGVVIGVGAVMSIATTVGPRTQIGALAFVPKHTSLAGDAVYVGIPAKRHDSRRVRSARMR